MWTNSIYYIFSLRTSANNGRKPRVWHHAAVANPSGEVLTDLRQSTTSGWKIEISYTKTARLVSQISEGNEWSWLLGLEFVRKTTVGRMYGKSYNDNGYNMSNSRDFYPVLNDASFRVHPIRKGATFQQTSEHKARTKIIRSNRVGTTPVAYYRKSLINYLTPDVRCRYLLVFNILGPSCSACCGGH